MKIELGENTVIVIGGLYLVLLIILFSGEPDLMDGIIERVRGVHVAVEK